VVGLFAGRGFNIDSVAVNVTTDPAYSKIVLTTRGNDAIIEQIVKQLRKLIRVKKVVEMTSDRYIERELCVVTVQAGGPNARQELERVVSLTGARVIAYSQTAFTVEATATSQEIDQLLELLRPLGIRDMVRSAPIAIARPNNDSLQAESVPPLGGVA
jgi:acetolactate synthase-1/3 small subunit